MTSPNALSLSAVVATAAGIDLASKAWAASALPGRSLALFPFLSLDLHFNRGISFSLFSADGPAGVLALLAVQATAIALMVWLASRSSHATERVGFALVVGGALGNLLDRAVDGSVVDFLDLHPFAWRLFTFNGADVFITVGVILLVAAALFQPAPPATTTGSPR